MVTTIPAAPSVATQNPPKSPQRVRRALDTWAVAALEGRHSYPTHYTAAVAVAAHALACGFRRGELWDRFEELARIEARDRRRTASPRRVQRFISNAWDYAESNRTPSADPFTLRAEIEAAREHLGRQKFTGRQNSLALVMEAALEAAEAQKTLAPSLAVRSVALATGLGKSTVQRALEKLVHLDLLQPATKSDGEKASTYRLRNSSRMVAQSGTQEVVPCGTKRVSHLGTASELARTDAFHALGRSAARVAAALSELEAQTPKALAAATGLAAKTVRAALRELEAVGLAQRSRVGRGYEWTLRADMLSEETLQRIAADYGTTGHHEKRKAQVTEQQRRWHEWQQGRAKARKTWKENRERFHRPQLASVAA